MKKQVHYAILKDMQKYIEGINPDDYECSDYTDPSVIEYVKDYYHKHLPVDATAWMRVHELGESSCYVKNIKEQVCFVRDKLCSLLMQTYTYEELCNKSIEILPMVISTHYSHSKFGEFPVFQINLEKYSIEMILMYDYNWKISIKSDKTLDFDCTGLFYQTEEISYSDCEGFPRSKVYGSYEQSHSQFTIKIDSHYDLYTFMFLLRKYLNIRNED